MTARANDEADVSRVIERINDAWAGGRPEDVAPFFSENIVMVNPDFTGRTTGRDACVASYVDFCKQATIHHLGLGEIVVDVFSDTAVASYSYQIDYEMGGERFADKGRDIFVFVREGGKWLAAWRTMIIHQPDSIN